MASKMRLYCMCSGLLHFDQSVFTYGRGMGQEVQVPTLIFLIEHDAGRVLFETGLDPKLADDPVGYWGETAKRWKPILTADQTIVPQLRQLGYKPSDIDYVVMSCLFRDHAGGMKYFPDATFVVQVPELQEAWWTTQSTRASYGNPYNLADVVPTREFQFIQLDGEDLDLFGDGRIIVLSAPCHARGEQALLVRLPKTGTILLPAGVIPTRRNFEEEVLTGRLMVSPREAYRSMMKLKRLAARERAMLIYHHDLDDWNQCRHMPSYYD